MDDKIEEDSRISKSNFGARKGYLIENAILEKRLLYDNSIFTGKETVHTISDLKACYNRYLPNLGGLVEELVGILRKVAKMLMKSINKFEHYLYTSYGISNEYYGGELYDLLSTG